VALLRQFNSIEGLFADLEAVANCGLRGAARLPEKLLAHRSQLQITRQLTRLVSELELPAGHKDIAWSKPSRAELGDFFQAFGLEQAMAKQLLRYDWLVD
jgi:hypothetical protein